MQGSDIELLVNGFKIPNFRGVYTIQSIPDLNIHEFVIFNLSATPPGTHWVYLTLRSKDKYTGESHFEIFDSLGCNVSYIEENLIKANSFYISNTYAVQPKTSNKCGLYCIYFAIMKSENEDYDFFDLMNVCFTVNLDENDSEVVKFIKTYQSFKK